MTVNSFRIESFYTRLHRYSERTGRSPLEDFLTEALVDIANRLPHSQQLTLLQSAGAPDNLLECLDQTDLRWESQFAILCNGVVVYPDICVMTMAEEKVAALIEVKVGAGFTSHMKKRDKDEDAIEPISQLRAYGYWLANSVDSTVDHACLGLLTQWTMPSAEDLPSISFSKIARWQDIFSWGSKLATTETLEPVPQFLVTNFIDFLQEQGLSMQSPTHEDFAAANGFLGRSESRIDHAVESVAVLLKPYKKLNKKADNLSYIPDGAAIWNSLDLKCFSKDWYVGWGFLFPRERGWWKAGHEPPITTYSPQAFVIFGSRDNDKHPFDENAFRANKKFAAWSLPTAANNEDDREALILRPIDFLLSTGDFTSEFSKWVVDHVYSIMTHFGDVA